MLFNTPGPPRAEEMKLRRPFNQIHNGLLAAKATVSSTAGVTQGAAQMMLEDLVLIIYSSQYELQVLTTLNTWGTRVAGCRRTRFPLELL